MLSFLNANENLFNCIGSVGGMLELADSYMASQLTIMTDPATGAVIQFNNESDIQAIIGGSYQGVLNTTGGSAGTVAQQVSVAILNRKIFRDTPQLGQTLTSFNTLGSLQEVIRQMTIAGATVLAMTVTASPQPFVGTGNGIIVGNVSRPSDGRVQELSYSENLTLTCTNDSYTGNATQGNELFALTGTGQQTNLFTFDWPLGSNASTNLNAIDGNSNNNNGNILTNSGFSDFTANAPNNFSITVGAAGTNIFQETTLVYDGSMSALRITGDAGGTLTSLQQVFGLGAGTRGTLSPVTAYGVNIFARRDGVIPAAGVLTIDLIDGGNNVILDQLGNPNSFTINLTLLTTNYLSYTGSFRTPLEMPSTYYLRMHLTTALTNGRSVYFDKLSLGDMTQAYPSGPFISVHAGSIPFVQGDTGVCVINNSRGAGGSLSTFQTLFQRFFFGFMMQNELLLPSSATPTISDNLIG